MKDKPLKTSRRQGAFVTGLAATAVIVLVGALGAGDRVELMALDRLFRHFSPVPSGKEILNVDIDDGSIERIGRWPWPRETLAGVIGVLDECGARTIALDIILPEPHKVRYVSAADDLYGRADAELAWDVPPTPVFDDALLAGAIEKAGNVAVPMHIDFLAAAGEDNRPDSERQAALDPQLHQRAPEAMSRFALDPDLATDTEIADGPMTPPLVTFAAAAGTSGFVTFEPDVDGIVRHIRLLGRSGGCVYMQFALALAADELADRHGGGPDIRVNRKSVELSFPDGAKRVIPTNEEGEMLIGWHGLGDDEDVSVSTVALVWQLRQSLDHNNRLARLTVLEIAKLLAQEDLLELFTQADQLYAQRVGVERDQYVATLRGTLLPADDLAALLEAEDALDNVIQRQSAQLRQDLDDFYLASRPTEPGALAAYERLVELRDRLAEIDATNAQIDADIDVQKALVRSRAAGRICLVGSTATSSADFVPTPLHPRTPGGVVHGNIVSTILAGRFVRPAGAVAAVLVVLLAGTAVAAIAAWRPMLQAALVAAGLAAAYLAFAAWAAFGLLDLWLPIVGPLAAVVASYLAVAVFRQLTEQRAKQQIRKMFAHALSPMLVDRLLVDPSLAELGGQRRHITCMFSDLAGFTAMSERLGPQQTVHLLNRYFDRVTAVVQRRHEGYLNKFLGDGVFCFFGAPVYQPDHAARALRAAVDCHRQVAELNAKLAGEFGNRAKLSVRVGITTGEAMVGNCGSSDRMDYTAIGDCVNLVSRLESANKLLGSAILVTDQARTLAGRSDTRARPIGRAMISGFAEPMRLWQVLPADDVSDDDGRALVEFARVVELFEARQFAEAASLFAGAGRLGDDDRPARIYEALCKYALSRKADEPWQPPSGTVDGVISIAPPLPAGATGGE